MHVTLTVVSDSQSQLEMYFTIHSFAVFFAECLLHPVVDLSTNSCVAPLLLYMPSMSFDYSVPNVILDYLL